jgi:hypothetical protein
MLEIMHRVHNISCIDETGNLAIRGPYPTVAVFYAEIEGSKWQLF